MESPLYAFGQSFSSCPLKLSLNISELKDGKGKWADIALAIPSLDEKATHIAIMDDVDRCSPGARRKLDNLRAYRSLARQMFPSAIIRLAVLTNANEGKSMPTLNRETVLRPEADNFHAADGWNLLPLRLVGCWVGEALNSTPARKRDTMTGFLLDFVEWSKSLGVLKVKNIGKEPLLYDVATVVAV